MNDNMTKIVGYIDGLVQKAQLFAYVLHLRNLCTEPSVYVSENRHRSYLHYVRNEHIKA